MLMSFTPNELRQRIKDSNDFGLVETNQRTDALRKFSNYELTLILKETVTTPIIIEVKL